MINGHGDDLYNYSNIKINFSSNVYSHVDHSGLYAHLSGVMQNIMTYPEPQPYSLEKAIAETHGIDKEMVCATNGATEAIYLLAQAYRDSSSAILVPTFSEYADACILNSHRLLKFYTLETMPDEASIIWICNPNNPTGEAYDKERITILADRYPGKLFIIDQSYEAFTPKRLFNPKDSLEHHNIVLLHSLTKQFAVPGLRIGYITAHPTIISRIRSFVKPWSVNSLAISAGIYLLKHKLEYELNLNALLEERERVASELEKLGVLEPWTSDTHYMLIRLRFGNARALKEYLACNHGILIRDASNFDGLDNSYFRIAIQTPDENNKLINAIKEWIYNF